MNVVQVGAPILLPPHPSKCQTCATEHEPEEPHNAQSLFYGVKFQMENGRGPDWRDAMAHCTPEVQARWKAALFELHGVDVDAGQINPPAKVKKAVKA